MNRWRAIGALWLTIGAGQLQAEEGFWTANELPLETIRQNYGQTPDTKLLDKLQLATLRLNSGCSGSFVSASGLILTNQHCLSRCLAYLSGTSSNLLQDGYTANSFEQEQSCPLMEAEQFLAKQLITAQPATISESLEKWQAKVVSGCLKQHPGQACEIVRNPRSLEYELVRYQRYSDLRLVFAPGSALAGAKESAQFPSYALDFALLRAVSNGQAASTPDFFSIAADGPQAEELLLTAGYPARSQRIISKTQLQSLRDVILPYEIDYLSGLRKHSAILAEQIDSNWTKHETETLEKQIRTLQIQQAMLGSAAFAKQFAETEQALRSAEPKGRKQRKAYKQLWAELEATESRKRESYAQLHALTAIAGYQPRLFAIARHLVRAANELEKPNSQRLPEYREASLPQLTQWLLSATAIQQEFEISKLSWALQWMQTQLGNEHPAVILSLADLSAQQRALQLLSETELASPANRRKYWRAGQSAIASSEDPLIVLARQLEPYARERRRQQDELATQEQRISQTLYAQVGYTQAAHDLRLGYGRMQGWQEKDKAILPLSSFGGFIARNTLHLGKQWARAETDTALATPVNFSSNHDTVAGHSGSPLVNSRGELVGLVFDTNSYGLVGQYLYHPDFSRAVSVHPRMIKITLQQVLQQHRLLAELFPKRN